MAKQRAAHGGDEPDVFHAPGGHGHELSFTGRAEAEDRFAFAKAPAAESTRHTLTPTASIDRSSTVYSRCKSPVPGGRAAGQRRWLGFDAHPPHEQGVGVLRFIPVGAVEGVDGGRPTSRGLPPAAVFGDGATEESPVPQKGILKGLIP